MSTIKELIASGVEVPEWLAKADVSDESVTIAEGCVVWKSGTWKSGTWESGTWESGTWLDGTWLDGTWLDGTWESGTWESSGSHP